MESKFHQVAKENIEDGHLLETMAFLVGIEVDGVYHSNELIFPNQISKSDMVDDIGMYYYLTNIRSLHRWKIILLFVSKCDSFFR